MRVLNHAFNNRSEIEEHASAPLAGGIISHGYQCGMIWGASLAAGAQAHRLFGPGPQAETMAINAAQKLVESFRAYKGEINCLEITDTDKSSSAMKMIFVFFIKGGVIGCMRQSAKYAQIAFREINSAFFKFNVEPSNQPVSCAAMLAKKMGASDMHAVMAAGFAGGIGLCGGACGALGAAIWISGMNRCKEGNGKIGFKNPQALAAIEKFLKCTDYKFECSEIVGRKFENISDHACYLREGGCSKIIEVLAAE